MLQRTRIRRGVVYGLVVIVILGIVMVLVNYSHFDNGSIRPSTVERDYVMFQDYDDPTEKKSYANLPKEGEKSRSPVKLNLYRGYFSPQKKMYNGSCVLLKTLKGMTPICVYSKEKDNMISSYVSDYGTWEEDLLNATGSVMAAHPNMEFLDLGCNIGVYTLFVAKMKHKVVSVDAIKTNLALLYKSLRMGNLHNYITLIENCLSDVYETVSMNVPVGNIGGAHVTDVRQNGGTAISVETIKLDDLTPLFSNKEVFIKMDIEGYELRALNGGHKFFQTVNVKYILMEWVHHRRNENGQNIINFLVRNGLLPYKDVHGKEFLDPDGYYLWPENVFWIKR